MAVATTGKPPLPVPPGSASRHHLLWNEHHGSIVLVNMEDDRRARCWSAVLFALPWPLPVYAMVGSLLIVVNEQVLGEHIFDASRIAEGAAFLALLFAAGWSDRHNRTIAGRCR